MLTFQVWEVTLVPSYVAPRLYSATFGNPLFPPIFQEMPSLCFEILLLPIFYWKHELNAKNWLVNLC